ncbi:MAG TPA: homoserine dehydrogenase, partial [Dehalococcoidia bacterium]|nr:homoserine dehydrogenase [Dehalococcoidia bacterium]
MGQRPVRVSLLGLGVVGTGVATALHDRGDLLADRAGGPIDLRHVLVRDPSKARSVELAKGVLTTDPTAAIEDPEVDIVVEVMGGEEPARSYLERALRAGKHVVTANKEVIAKHGQALVVAARAAGRVIRYEASVGGGIPLIEPFKRDLRANRLRSIHAIINGTTNYILTQMATS